MMKRTLHFLLIAMFSMTIVVVSGCDRNNDAKTAWITSNKLSPGPIHNASLTPEQMDRIQRLQQTFSEVDPSPLAQWVEGFKRDANPDNEIHIWESMAKAYGTFTATNQLTLAAKKEVYGVVLVRSGASEDQVLKHVQLKILSEAQAKEILQLYSDKPEPIKVIAQ